MADIEIFARQLYVMLLFVTGVDYHSSEHIQAPDTGKHTTIFFEEAFLMCICWGCSFWVSCV